MVQIEELINKVVEIPILKERFFIIVVDDLSKLNDVHNTDIKADMYDAVTYKANNGDLIVAFEKGKATPGIVLHESIHIVNHIFTDKGIQLDRINDEFQAYFTQWVFEQIDEFLREVA